MDNPSRPKKEASSGFLVACLILTSVLLLHLITDSANEGTVYDYEISDTNLIFSESVASTLSMKWHSAYVNSSATPNEYAFCISKYSVVGGDTGAPSLRIDSVTPAEFEYASPEAIQVRCGYAPILHSHPPFACDSTESGWTCEPATPFEKHYSCDLSVQDSESMAFQWHRFAIVQCGPHKFALGTLVQDSE